MKAGILIILFATFQLFLGCVIPTPSPFINLGSKEYVQVNGQIDKYTSDNFAEYMSELITVPPTYKTEKIFYYDIPVTSINYYSTNLEYYVVDFAQKFGFEVENCKNMYGRYCSMLTKILPDNIAKNFPSGGIAEAVLLKNNDNSKIHLLLHHYSNMEKDIINYNTTIYKYRHQIAFLNNSGEEILPLRACNKIT